MRSGWTKTAPCRCEKIKMEAFDPWPEAAGRTWSTTMNLPFIMSSISQPIPVLYYNTSNSYFYYSSSFFLAVGVYRIFATLKRFSFFVQNSGARGLYNSKGYASLLAFLCSTVLLLSAIGNFIGIGPYRVAAAILFPADTHSLFFT